MKEELMNEYKNYSTEQLIEAKKNSDDILLKAKHKIYKIKTISGGLGIATVFGIGMFVCSANPIIKFASLFLSLAPAVACEYVLSSPKTRMANNEFMTAKKINNALQEEIFERLEKEQGE